MDNIVGLYTGTEGRISRKSWWLGVVGLVVVNILISLLLLPMVGLSMMPDMAALMSGGNVDTAALSQAIVDSMRRSAWASLILFVIFAYPTYALSIKRRHDKDNSGLDVIIYLALTVVVLLLQALGIGMETMTINNLTIPTTSMWLNVLLFAIGIFGLYLLVVLGFLKGTPGPNQYGPAPLGSTSAASA